MVVDSHFTFKLIELNVHVNLTSIFKKVHEVGSLFTLSVSICLSYFKLARSLKFFTKLLNLIIMN